MAKTVLTLKSLHKLGDLEGAFDEQLRRLVQDCKDRPGMEQSRTLAIEFDLRPAPNDPEDVIVHCKLKSKTPSKKIDAYRMQSTVNGGLKFQPHSPTDPEQEDFNFDP